MSSLTSNIKSFDKWLEDELDSNTFDENTIKIMRFTYDSAIAETLKYVLSLQEKESIE